MPNGSVHNKYIEKIWDLYLKATIYQNIQLAKQKQQFCAGLPNEMKKYVHLQRPKSIMIVIHHTIVALQINFQGGKKPSQGKQAGEQEGKGTQAQNASKVPIAKNKTKNQ